MTQPFVEMAKIARLSREMIVTEKIDGTNASVLVTEEGRVIAGSRNRWLTIEADNFGFAKWVAAHEDELRALGPGQHFGEWWGNGIQRGYGLANGDKRFSLFNVSRWADGGRDVRPPCCGVVPTIYAGPFDTGMVDAILRTMAEQGSLAVPGWRKPEGVVVFHVASGQLFKKTLDKNDGHKGVAA